MNASLIAPPTPRRGPFVAIVALALLLLFSTAACRDDATSLPGPPITPPPKAGPARSVLLGFAAISAGDNPADYARSFATAAEWGDVIMIQRAPPWAEFMPGGEISAETEELTRFELSLIRQYGLRVFFVIDPTDPTVERSRLVDIPDLESSREGFANPALREAFGAYAAYIARNYRPQYLALGAEVDMYADRNPDQFEDFLRAYDEAFAVAKAASPDTLVFPTFQLEDIEGSFGPTHPPRWDLLLAFAGRMDALALTTYPFLTELSSARALREDYYSQLRDLFPGPIIIAGAGYTSAPVEGSSVPGTEEDQLIYLERLRDDAEKLGFDLVVWLSPYDPPVSPTGTAARFYSIGLLAADGTPKLAWPVWQEWSQRPWFGP